MSQHVVPQKARDLGYEFRFPALEPALADLLKA
jgi:NAD dependent epimerase/dehydratase family enzyme